MFTLASQWKVSLTRFCEATLTTFKVANIKLNKIATQWPRIIKPDRITK